MDRNFFLAIALSVLVYVGWFTFLNKKYKPAPKPQRPGAAATTLAGARGAAAKSQEKAQGWPERAPISRQASLSAAPPATVPQKGGLDGALPFMVQDLQLKVQPLGAGLVSYRYPTSMGPVELVLDPDPGFFSTWPELKFRSVGRSGGWPVFEAVHPSGVLIRKEYLFRELGAVHTLRLTLTNPGSAPASLPAWDIAIGPGLGNVETKGSKGGAVAPRVIALRPPAEKAKSPKLKEFDFEDEPGADKGPRRWVGVDNQYFLAVLFPPEKNFPEFHYGSRVKEVMRKSWLGGKKKVREHQPEVRLAATPITIPPGDSIELEIPFYFGPKGYIRLEQFGLGLERSVSFGWFNRIGRLTMRVLNFFYGWTGNWGWAILLLTFSLQIVMGPLTYKSMKSMAMMKKVAPEQAKIQQKFKKDPQRLNTELMALYKKRGVNPLGGCLPMMAQMPIFIALFNTLRNAWELHGAPWILWIHDLSAPDPFYVLPIVMGAIMFLQNKMNPTPAGDPNQTKIMQYLPIIFTFMFLNFPAGLVLYWLTNSVLSFGQQIVIKRRMGI